MSEALLLSVIQKLDISYQLNETDEDIKEEMESVIKEMREIVDIVRDKKLEEGRSLNFLVSDLVDMAEYAIDLFEQNGSYSWLYRSIHSWMGEIKNQMLKMGDDGAEMRSSETVEDDKYVVGLEEDVQMLLRTKIIGGIYSTVLIKGMSGIGKTTLAGEIQSCNRH